MEKVSAIVIHEHGDPAAVARVEPLELAPPLANEARVRMLFAPINPADLNVIEGKYPVRPALPAVPGVEGAGVVEAVGESVRGLAAGAMVLLPHSFGTWREAGNVDASQLTPVPDGIAPEQAAMMRINPATALRMLRDFVELKPGDWVIQNAANSGVGRAVIQIARHLGLRTINVVRRAELIDEMRAAGGDVVLLDTDDMPKQLAGAAPLLALNAVGGDSAVRLANALAPGGTLVTYGAMARQPLKIPNGLLIFKDLCWRGFWVTQWAERTTAEARAAMFSELFALSRSGALRLPVGRTFPLAQCAEALTLAAGGSRAGKILFAMP